MGTAMHWASSDCGALLCTGASAPTRLGTVHCTPHTHTHTHTHTPWFNDAGFIPITYTECAHWNVYLEMKKLEM